MVDKNTQFYAILTNVGAAKQANADALGIAWKITQMGVGDANGNDPTPSATQKALINEWRRAPLNQLKVDDNDPSIIVAEQVIPADIGGMWIREIGLYDEAGDLVAVANCAPTYKPVLSQGSGRTQVLRMSLVVSNAVNVQLKIDPSVVLATREWVTEELARQDFKHSVLAATTGNITLSGLQTVDGIALPAGARVLVKDQSTAKDNGLYLVAAGAWPRCADANTSAKVTPNLLVLVERGTVYGDSAWQLITDGTISLGVTALTFEMVFGRTGVAPGTYRSVQVDKYGRVVAATNPSTLAGYGITDVYTKSETYSRSEIAKAIADSVTGAVNGLVDSAPGALDTLKELGAAIGNDPNFATSMVNELAKRAPLASPKLTGVPEAPTAAVGADTAQIATMAALLAGMQNFGLGRDVGKEIDNLDDLVYTGFYRAQGTAVRNPYPGAPIVVLNVAFNQAGTFQLVASCSSNTSGARLYWRTRASGTWADWQGVGRLNSPELTGEPTAPTASTGTKTKQLATTEFVDKNKRNYAAGVLGFSQNTVLMEGDSGRVYQANANNLVVMLPGPATVTQGTTYAFRNPTGGTLTLGSAAGTTFVSNTSAATLVLQPGEYVELCNNSSTNWFVTSRGKLGEVAELNSPSFEGDPKAPTKAVGTNTDQLATMKALLQGMAAFGLGTASAPLCADVNAQVTSGFYFVSTGQSANLPLNNNGFLIHLPWNGTSAMLQIYVAASLNQMKWRTKSSDVWRAWNDFAFLDSPTLTGTPQAPTAATSSNSQQIATTGFVKAVIAGLVEARAYLSGVTNVTANLTLTADSTGYVFRVTNAGLTLTLPDASKITAGRAITVRNESVGELTLVVPAGNIYQAVGANSAKLVLAKDEAVELVATGPNWIVVWRCKLSESASVNAPDLKGEVTVSGVNVTRYICDAVPASPALIGRMDPSAFYFLLTNANDSRGNFNNLRPLTIGLATGVVTLNEGGYTKTPAANDDSKQIPTTAWVNAKGRESAPVGKVAHFALSEPPPGWLKRNGAAVSRTTYADLFAAIGTKFGAGDGSTTFNVPDDRELIDRAWTDGLNAADPGRALFSTQAGQNESHVHGGTTSTNGAHAHTASVPRDLVNGEYGGPSGASKDAVMGDEPEEGYQTITTSTGGAHNHTLNISASGGNETRMANRAYLACIKY